MSTKSVLVQVESAGCNGCGRCAVVCPHRLFRVVDGRRVEPGPDLDRLCLTCGHCVAVCPVEAVRHREFPAGAPRLPDRPTDPGAVLALFRRRRSVRNYGPSAPTREQIRTLLAAATSAPTGHNNRGVACVAVLTRGRRRGLALDVLAFYRRLFRWLDTPVLGMLVRLAIGRTAARELTESLPGARRAEQRLLRGEDPLFHGAPCVLLLHAPRGETAEVDCALAAAQVCLLAPSLGLGTCYIGYASAVLSRYPRLAARHGIDRERRCHVVLTVGQPAVPHAREIRHPPLPLRFI